MTDAGQPQSSSSSVAHRLEQLVFLRGRFGRKQFWVGSLGLLVFIVLLFIALVEMSNPKGSSSSDRAALVWAVPFLWLHCALIVQRLHDLGWSGWWTLLLGPLAMLMMYVSNEIYFWIEQSYEAQQVIKPLVIFLQLGAFALLIGGFILIGCLRGIEGPNPYGPDPKTAPPAQQ